MTAPHTLARPRAVAGVTLPPGGSATPPAGPGETQPGRGPSRDPRIPSRAPDWTRAACAGSASDWVPDGPAEESRALTLLRPVCAACPLTVQCAAWATAEHLYGIWGGTTTAGRDAARIAEKATRDPAQATPTTCSVDGCLKPRSARGMCDTHLSRLRRGTDMLAPVRPRRGQHGVEKVRDGEYLVPGPCGRVHLAGYIAEASSWACPVCAAVAS